MASIYTAPCSTAGGRCWRDAGRGCALRRHAPRRRPHEPQHVLHALPALRRQRARLPCRRREVRRQREERREWRVHRLSPLTIPAHNCLPPQRLRLPCRLGPPHRRAQRAGRRAHGRAVQLVAPRRRGPRRAHEGAAAAPRRLGQAQPQFGGDCDARAESVEPQWVPVHWIEWGSCGWGDFIKLNVEKSTSEGRDLLAQIRTRDLNPLNLSTSLWSALGVRSQPEELNTVWNIINDRRETTRGRDPSHSV